MESRLTSERAPQVVYVAGARGLVGSAVVRHLRRFAPQHEVLAPTSTELDLRDREAVFGFLRSARPDVLVLAAAKVGGIEANDRFSADFLSENLQIQVNVMDAATEVRTPRLLFLGSSCIYPKFAEQPIREDSLLTGPLEETNKAYAIAKIAGIVQIEAVRKQHSLRWISAMPTNLYGPGDNFDAGTSHVLPAMLRRFTDARSAGADHVTCWGSGTPRREFLHVDDLASALDLLIGGYDSAQTINVGTGTDVTVAELATMVAQEVGYTGEIHWDTSRPDGTPRKVLDVSRLRALGWAPEVDLREGLHRTHQWWQGALESGTVRGV